MSGAAGKALTEGPAGIFDPARRALTVGIVLGVLLIAFESMAVATILPLVERALNGRALYGWAFSAFFMGYLLSTVVLGQLADRFGARGPFGLALALFAAGLLLAGSAPTMLVFILGRALQGLGGGGLVAVSYLVINRAYPDALRARMLALLSSAWVLPGLLGPSLAALVAARFSWHMVFLGLLPLAALVALLTLRPLGQVRGGQAPLDTRRLWRAGMAALGVTLGLSALQQHTLAWGLALGALGLALAGPALWALFPSPRALAWWTARRETLASGYATRFCLTFGFFGAEAFVPLTLTDLRGVSPVQAGLNLTASALTWSLTSILHARFDERTQGRYRHRVAGLGALVVLAGLGLTALVLLTPGLSSSLTIPTWALCGLGMGLAFQSHTLVVFRAAPGGQEGQVSGTLQMADVLGSAIGAGVGGAMVATLGLRPGVSLLFALCLAGLLLGAVMTRGLRLGAAEKERPVPSPP